MIGVHAPARILSDKNYLLTKQILGTQSYLAVPIA